MADLIRHIHHTDCWHGCSCVWAVNGHVLCLSQRLYVAGIVWDSITHLVLLLWSIRAAVKLVKFGDMVTKGLAWRYDSNTTAGLLHDIFVWFILH